MPKRAIRPGGSGPALVWRNGALVWRNGALVWRSGAALARGRGRGLPWRGLRDAAAAASDGAGRRLLPALPPGPSFPPPPAP